MHYPQLWIKVVYLVSDHSFPTIYTAGLSHNSQVVDKLCVCSIFLISGANSSSSTYMSMTVSICSSQDFIKVPPISVSLGSFIKKLLIQYTLFMHMLVGFSMTSRGYPQAFIFLWITLFSPNKKHQPISLML